MNIRSLSPLKPPAPSNGLANAFSIPWQTFVQIVVEATVEAYRRMCDSGVVQKEWEEDAFTATLAEDYLKPVFRERQPSFAVALQNPVYIRTMKTDTRKSGRIPTNRAKKIDIKVFLPSWDDTNIYFTWECKKLIGDKTLNPAYSNLASKYVSEGIFRFIEGDYSSNVETAGMLGYVLEGEINQIVDSINTSMMSSRRKQPLSNSDRLTSLSPINGFTEIFQSRHHRTNDLIDIQIIHLFLAFTFS